MKSESGIERQTSLAPQKAKLSTKEMTAKVEEAMRRRYCRPHWASFFELWGETDHRADCIAFNMYRSRGFRVLGFEIKALRNDWLRELKNGCKADYFVGQCDEWYIVEAKKGIVKREELPEGWGLMTLQGGRLYTKVKSDLKFKGVPSREFFVRMIQQSHEQNVDESILYYAEQKGVAKGRKEALEDNYGIKDLEDKAKIVDKLTDMKLPLWHYSKEKIEKIVLALNILDALDKWGIDESLKSIDWNCDRVKEKIKECRENIEKLRGVGLENGKQSRNKKQRLQSTPK